MTNYTKKPLAVVRYQVAKMQAGDILTAYQARDIGWMAFRSVGLECVEYPQPDPNKRFVRLQPMSLEISGCTSDYRAA